jgi:hypothetical protein
MEEGRALIGRIHTKGLYQMREVNRAQALAGLDQGNLEARITAGIGIGLTAVWCTRAEYLPGSVELAMFDIARSGRRRQYDTAAEARVTALARTTPPAGSKRRTLAELERADRQEQGLGRVVSREAV